MPDSRPNASALPALRIGLIAALVGLAEADIAVRTAEAVAPVTWDTFVVPLDDATERLARAWNQVTHLEAVVNTPALRGAYNAQLPKVTRFWSALGQNLALYRQYRALADAPEAAHYDDARRKVLENALRDFRLGGAELPDAQKARFAEVKEELAALSAKFSQNVLDATDEYEFWIKDKQHLGGLPADVVAAARAAAKADDEPGWKFTLQMPCYLPVQTYADDRALRETLYHANAVRASELADNEALDNSTLIDRILALRAELAALLGFASYAEYSLATKMARDPAEVVDFLQSLARVSRPAAEREFTELEQFAGRPLRSWDVAFYSEKLKNERLQVSEGSDPADAPSEDAQEELWRTYYASTFNPARLRTRMMQSEMPKQYWKNLPEASLIPELVASAASRTVSARIVSISIVRSTSSSRLSTSSRSSAKCAP